VSGNNVINGEVRLYIVSGDRPIGVDAGSTLTLTQGISSGGSAPYSMTKVGDGTLVLSGGSPGTFTCNINAGTLALTGSASLANSPLITIAGGATFDVSALTAGQFSLGSARTLKGNGTIIGNLNTAASSTISAGMSPGHLSIFGNYTQAGTMLAEIGGTAQGVTYDWIEVKSGGTATFAPGAIVDVDLLSFVPSAGSYFDILTAEGGITNLDLAGITFDFSGAPSPFEWRASIVSLGERAEALRLLAAPEPASVSLLALGLAALLRRNRRTK
jgi:hypothetical protein